ncbi:MAG: DUF433 domain-containing protein [Armatimonadetes bacterium]|nr:DUF433 domain-containing protein [Armatimonadota bacterium]
MTAKRIVTNPKVLQGKPVIEGTRISVAFVLELLAAGMDVDAVHDEYPELMREDILAAINYARQVVENEDIVPSVEAA